MSASSYNEFIPHEVQQHISIPSVKRKFINNYALKTDDHTIHVLQWNILAQALSYSEGNFVRVTNETVAYETRKWRILEQILIHQPDLCSLQEMDIYDCFLKEQLAKYGYICYFTPKPNSRCLSFEDDLENFKGPDGVLLCYKKNVFKEINRSNSDLPNDGRYGRQVFSILELEHIPSSSLVVFIGTHFKAKKQFALSRINQTNALVDFVNKKYTKKTNIIVAGDFNGEIDEPFYEILLKAGFNSAYRVLMNNHEPPYTTWKFKSREETYEKEESQTIDYIFYRSESLVPIAYLEVPTKTDIGPNGLPSANYPSDHLALQTIFLVRS
ncbi:unnamed protein product [Rotaria sp. Silwood1]|nr:unnamed protein product [Rotaria sp. Silwood1]CAF0855979.1 unnamed protein product [Rotaria sp. Silwood1]CAF0871458.1 unnamed protein product [Rotaria sp. Silwood1]CAF3354228.1 unnamed protein product [Rotaria sp. Silwood1]CAF3378730.1 unnamed protein product [Rotaria sp. Silwood1]